MGSAIKVTPGDTYGHLSVLAEALRGRSGQRRMHCICRCGATAVVTLCELRTGGTKSCGCLLIESRTKHKKSSTREYRVWAGVIQRCTNPRETNWARYGGRGISICKRWRNSFENFLSDMGPRPGSKYSIERVDNNGNYEPGNCVWATRKQQSSNTSRCIPVTLNGRTQTLTGWALEFGLNPVTVNNRHRTGYPIERLFEPLHQGVK